MQTDSLVRAAVVEICPRTMVTDDSTGDSGAIGVSDYALSVREVFPLAVYASSRLSAKLDSIFNVLHAFG